VKKLTICLITALVLTVFTLIKTKEAGAFSQYSMSSSFKSALEGVFMDLGPSTDILNRSVKPIVVNKIIKPTCAIGLMPFIVDLKVLAPDYGDLIMNPWSLRKVFWRHEIGYWYNLGEMTYKEYLALMREGMLMTIQRTAVNQGEYDRVHGVYTMALRAVGKFAIFSAHKAYEKKRYTNYQIFKSFLIILRVFEHVSNPDNYDGIISAQNVEMHQSFLSGRRHAFSNGKEGEACHLHFFHNYSNLFQDMQATLIFLYARLRDEGALNSTVLLELQEAVSLVQLMTERIGFKNSGETSRIITNWSDWLEKYADTISVIPLNRTFGQRSGTKVNMF